MNITNSSLFKDECGQDFADIPLIKQSDNNRLLPKYTAILSKSGDDEVYMDDLDQLQLELEKLCSTCTVRIRYLLSEIGEADGKTEGHDRSAYEKATSRKKRSDDISKFKDYKNMKIIKKRGREISKVAIHKNDTSEKFWASLKPFCSGANNNDIALLDSLINEFNKDIEVKIPEVGENYTNGWSGETTNDDQNLTTTLLKNTPSIDIKKNYTSSIVETFAMPLTQRLLAALIEEKPLNNQSTNGVNGQRSNIPKLSEFAKLKPSTGGQKSGTSIDRRLKKELMEQGIITMEDFLKF